MGLVEQLALSAAMAVMRDARRPHPPGYWRAWAAAQHLVLDLGGRRALEEAAALYRVRLDCVDHVALQRVRHAIDARLRLHLVVERQFNDMISRGRG